MGFPYCSKPNPTFQNKLTVFKKSHNSINSEGFLVHCEICKKLHCWTCGEKNFEICGYSSEGLLDGCFKAYCADCHDGEINQVGREIDVSLCDECYERHQFVCKICNEKFDKIDSHFDKECAFCKRQLCWDCGKDDKSKYLEIDDGKIKFFEAKQCEDCQQQEMEAFKAYAPKEFPRQIISLIVAFGSRTD